MLGVSALEGPGYHNGREKIQVAERWETGRGRPVDGAWGRFLLQRGQGAGKFRQE